MSLQLSGSTSTWWSTTCAKLMAAPEPAAGVATSTLALSPSLAFRTAKTTSTVAGAARVPPAAAALTATMTSIKSGTADSLVGVRRACVVIVVLMDKIKTPC